MRRFYAAPEQFSQDEVQLSLEESRHLRDVLRLREGDEVSVFDGDGKEFRCRIIEAGKAKSSAKLKVLEEARPAAPESSLDLTLAVALLKGEKFDLVIQKATELGVNKIIPLKTLRADVKIKSGDANKKLERWRRVALEAVKQCGRAKLPEIAAPVEFPEIFQNRSETMILFSEREGSSLRGFVSAEPGLMKITAVVGSEGGWEDSELALAREYRAQIITLGGRILRAETAGITVTALLQNLYGDLH